MKAKTLCSVIAVQIIALAGATAGDAIAISGSDVTGGGDYEFTPMLKKGNQELSLAGSFDWDGFEEFNYDVRTSYGWFVQDAWEVGVIGSGRDQGQSSIFSAGLFTEYNFVTTGKLVPFIGVSAEWSNVDFDVNDLNIDSDAVLLTGSIGVKYFIREYMAISAALTYSWATDDIFDAVDSFDESSSSIVLGLRFYF